MAKLHSELRIKAVDDIIGGSEGDPVQYSSGDVVYDLTSGKFKKHDGAAWQDAVTGVSADLSGTSIDALQDVDLTGINPGDILVWDDISSSFVPQAPSSGPTDNIVEGNSKVEVIDDVDGSRIEFGTSGAPKWQITSAGHILPTANETYDIGSAELKVRDFYLSNNSLWIGDEHKISIDNGVMKFRRRKYEAADVPATWQSVWNAYTDADAFTWTSAAIVGLIDGNSGSGALSIYDDLGAIPSDLTEMTLAHWERAIGWMKKVAAGTIGSDANINGSAAWNLTFIDVNPNDGQMDDPYPNGIQSLFAQDTDFVDNFQPQEPASIGNLAGVDLSTSATEGQILVWSGVSSAFEPKDNSIDNLSDTTITDKGTGDALVWTGAVYENLHASELVRLTVLSHSQSWNAGGAPEVYEFAQHFLGRSGGRVLLNTTDFNPAGGDKIEISMDQLLAYNASWSAPSLNFEIFSKGTQPFDITLTNGTGSTQTLYSDFQSDIVIANGAEGTLSVGEGQMVVLWTTGQYWYYQIRSGL